MVHFQGGTQGLVKPRMRAMMSATALFSMNLVGFGLGPVVVGELSDYFGGGTELRRALLLLMVFMLWAAVHFLLGARHYVRDLERERLEPDDCWTASVLRKGDPDLGPGVAIAASTGRHGRRCDRSAGRSSVMSRIRPPAAAGSSKRSSTIDRHRPNRGRHDPSIGSIPTSADRSGASGRGVRGTTSSSRSLPELGESKVVMVGILSSWRVGHRLG
jgi:hypothetical protein